jgi:hypothetical protein
VYVSVQISICHLHSYTITDRLSVCTEGRTLFHPFYPREKQSISKVAHTTSEMDGFNKHMHAACRNTAKSCGNTMKAGLSSSVRGNTRVKYPVDFPWACGSISLAWCDMM